MELMKKISCSFIHTRSTHAHTHIHTHTHTSTHTSTHTLYTCTYAYIFFIHTYIHTHMYVCMYVKITMYVLCFFKSIYLLSTVEKEPPHVTSGTVISMCKYV